MLMGKQDCLYKKKAEGFPRASDSGGETLSWEEAGTLNPAPSFRIPYQ